jgi:type I site-specific restriction endonuclease
MGPLALLALLAAVAYLILVFRTKHTAKEAFEDDTPTRNCRTVLDTSLSQEKPYMTNQDKYGDFEQDFVFQNEGGFDPTKQAIDAARRRIPFEWSQLPPSSSLFQQQQSLFTNEKEPAQFSKETFENIDSMKVLPPDDSADQAELDALRMYKPVMAKDMKSLDQRSVDDLVQQLYGKKGMVAKVAQQANNVYQIYDVQPKEPKIVYEDEVQSSMQDNALNPISNPNNAVLVPGVVRELEIGLAPNGRGESMGYKRQEYSNYNPNLENIFGPKMQFQQYG